MVIEKSLEHLNQKYNEKFRVVSVNMNSNEGNRGSADLLVSPENDSSLSFRVVYNYSDEKLTWENYKGVIWNREIAREAEALIQPGAGEVKVKAAITAKGSITLNSTDLPFKKNYMEILPVIERPAVSFDIDYFLHEGCRDQVFPYGNIISAAGIFRDKGFGKVMFTVNLFCEDERDKPEKKLRFKLTKELPPPGVNSLKKLTLNSGESPIDTKVSAIYNEARQLHQSGDKNRALQLYMNVISVNDNPYRYDPYAPVESGFVIESAFYAAEIEKERGNKDRAGKLYSLLVERVKYIEVKGDFYEMEKEAVKYLDGAK
jgi:hypothetical protein